MFKADRSVCDSLGLSKNMRRDWVCRCKIRARDKVETWNTTVKGDLVSLHTIQSLIPFFGFEVIEVVSKIVNAR